MYSTLHSHREFRRCPTHQHHDGPRTPGGSSFTPRISRTLHAPATQQAGTTERIVIRAEKFAYEKLIIRAENLEDAPRATDTTSRDQVVTRAENFEDTMPQRHYKPRPLRGPSFAWRISRTLHVPASRQTQTYCLSPTRCLMPSFLGIHINNNPSCRRLPSFLINIHQPAISCHPSQAITTSIHS